MTITTTGIYRISIQEDGRQRISFTICNGEQEAALRIFYKSSVGQATPLNKNSIMYTVGTYNLYIDAERGDTIIFDVIDLNAGTIVQDVSVRKEDEE